MVLFIPKLSNEHFSYQNTGAWRTSRTGGVIYSNRVTSLRTGLCGERICRSLHQHFMHSFQHFRRWGLMWVETTLKNESLQEDLKRRRWTTGRDTRLVSNERFSPHSVRFCAVSWTAPNHRACPVYSPSPVREAVSCMCMWFHWVHRVHRLSSVLWHLFPELSDFPLRVLKYLQWCVSICACTHAPECVSMWSSLDLWEGVSESGKLALRKSQHSQATHLFWASTAHHNISRGKWWTICCVLSLTALRKWQQTPGSPIKHMSLHQNKGLIEWDNRPDCCSTHEGKKKH